LSESITEVSRQFFEEIVKPILQEHFPDETAQTAFGVFGYGSEVLGLDDQYSSDHHWGLRINALIPDYLVAIRKERMLQAVADNLPDTYQGHSLREGYTGVKSLEIDSLEGFLKRTIGIISPPETHKQWLSIPEEDIIHVVNGEIWFDPSGCFSAIRRAFAAYYPEPVRLRRIAHWCRYFSGMGSYALKRAILRNNEYYANIAFSKAIRWGIQLAFMLDKTYYPYDKWLMAYFEKLPRLAEPLLPLVNEAVKLTTPWERKYELLNQLADVLDQTMVADGIIKPHPQFAESPTSGYRLLEHAYAEIIQSLPTDIQPVVPVWDQIYLEEFHSGYVASLDLATWDDILNLKPED
jgi:hypothetical protein